MDFNRTNIFKLRIRYIDVNTLSIEKPSLNPLQSNELLHIWVKMGKDLISKTEQNISVFILKTFLRI